MLHPYAAISTPSAKASAASIPELFLPSSYQLRVNPFFFNSPLIKTTAPPALLS